MNAKAPNQSLLGETGEIACFRRAFQSMQQNNLAAWSRWRPVFIHDDCVPLLGTIKDSLGGKASFVDSTSPEVAGDRREMWIVEERLKSWRQIQS